MNPVTINRVLLVTGVYQLGNYLTGWRCKFLVGLAITLSTIAYGCYRAWVKILYTIVNDMNFRRDSLFHTLDMYTFFRCRSVYVDRSGNVVIRLTNSIAQNLRDIPIRSLDNFMMKYVMGRLLLATMPSNIYCMEWERAVGITYSDEIVPNNMKLDSLSMDCKQTIPSFASVMDTLESDDLPRKHKRGEVPMFMFHKHNYSGLPSLDQLVDDQHSIESI